MNEIGRVLLLAVSAVFTHNIVFSRLLGCAALGEERRVEVSVGYGLVMAAVMTLASVCAWLVDRLLLAPLHLEFLQVIAFVAIIVGLSLLAERLGAKLIPGLGDVLDGNFMLIAANSAVLGVALLNAEAGYGFGYALASGLFCGLGYCLAVVLMGGVWERLEFSRIPEPMKGLPIALVSASLIALAFMGFAGMA